MIRAQLPVISVLFFSLCQAVFADVQLPRVFSSHMVLQREMPVPVWGKAVPNEKITVTFAGQSKTATADAKGDWSVQLDPLTASNEPATLTVSGNNQVRLDDVLVGEVWVGSGQSNIDTDVPDYLHCDPVLKEAWVEEHPQLRLYRSDVGDGWQLTGQAALRRYSAQLFYFGMKLQEELGVPVGVMEGAVRGSPAGHWITHEMLLADEKVKAEIDDYNRKRMEKFRGEHESWRKKIEEAKAKDKLPKEPKEPKEPQLAGAPSASSGDYFAAHIQPMIPFAIRGVLWDQGEGGPGTLGVSQRTLIAAMVRGWRRAWGQDFAWLYVQKPSGRGCALNPDDPVNRGAMAFTPELPGKPHEWQKGWPHRFEYLFMKDDNPRVFLVLASDLAPGVHPENKSGYGTRACRVALGAVYGRALEYYGPVYASHTVEGNKLRVKFSHIGKGLTCPAGQLLQGFALAGGDGKFYWAKAQIDGDTVVLSCPEVPSPVAASYAWAPVDITWANLFNRDGLPALSFKTE